MQVELSIVIVSWNVREHLHACLESIHERGTWETIVVDAASTDGTAEMIGGAFPAVKLIEPGENVGFTRGNNLGIEASRGRYVLLLNPDTEILDDALEKMIAYMDAQPEVGALGPKLLNTDMTVQSSRRRFPTLKTAFFESTWLQPYASQKILNHYYMLDIPDDRTAQVDWVQGAALMVRREVIDGVGVLDEGFFMYSEELDWQKRIKQAGWQVVYYPEARIIHHGGKSSEQAAAQRDIYFHTSKIRYFKKHHGAGIAFILRLFLIANYLWQLGLEGAKWLAGHKREMRKQRVQAYWQVLRSGLRVRG